MRILVALLALCSPALADHNNNADCISKVVGDLQKIEGLQVIKSQARSNRMGQPAGWGGLWPVHVEIETVLNGKPATYTYVCDDTGGQVKVERTSP